MQKGGKEGRWRRWGRRERRGKRKEVAVRGKKGIMRKEENIGSKEWNERGEESGRKKER